MEKKILLEINRMKEIMGMNIIVEAASPIIDYDSIINIKVEN
jgi:hypothetical protein